MLENYDQMIKGLKQMEKRNAPPPPITAEAAAKQAAGDGPSFGPVDAKVVIVEYSDFQCPHCGRAASVVQQLKKRYGKVVRFVFRQLPLSIHEQAPLAAEASLAAHAQGKFWPYHDLLFESPQNLGRESLESYAKKVGLDLAKFQKALDEHTYKKAVEQDMKLAEEVGINATPSMIVGTERVKNPTRLAVVTELIDAQLTAAGVEVPPGEPEAKPEPKPEPKPEAK